MFSTDVAIREAFDAKSGDIRCAERKIANFLLKVANGSNRVLYAFAVIFWPLE